MDSIAARMRADKELAERCMAVLERFGDRIAPEIEGTKTMLLFREGLYIFYEGIAREPRYAMLEAAYRGVNIFRRTNRLHPNLQANSARDDFVKALEPLYSSTLH